MINHDGILPPGRAFRDAHAIAIDGLVARARAEVARLEGLQCDGPYCVDCQDREFGVDPKIAAALAAEVERLRTPTGAGAG